MSDLAVGRNVVLCSLVTILVLNLAFAVYGASGATPAALYGRPIVLALACLLVWQGRLWARWLLLLVGFGVLLAGPISLGNRIPPLSAVGLLFWLASALYLLSLYALFAYPPATAFLASRAAAAIASSSGTAGA